MEGASIRPISEAGMGNMTCSFSDNDQIFVEIRPENEQSSTENCDASSKAKQAWSEKTFPRATAHTKKAEGSPEITKITRPKATTA